MQQDNILQPEEGKIVINHMPVYIRSVDRTFKDIAAWWTALQQAESTYYPNRSDLYDIYATAELDGHLSGIIDKRVKNVTNKQLIFKKGEKKVDALDELIKLEIFKELRKERFKRYTHGLCGFEFIPGAEFKYKTIPLKHINVNSKKITKEQWGTEGFVYEDVWNIIVLGKENDFGLLNKCTPYAIWKKGNMGDWAQYIEVFGQPMIVFTYDAHDEKTKKELDEIMRNIGSGTKLQVPKQVELKLEDGKQNNGDGELQDKFRRACNEEMSVIVLGVTETTTSSKSSGYAQSETHVKQQDEVIKDDMDDELKFLNSKSFLDILKSYGYPVDGGEWCYEKDIDLKEVKAKVDIGMTVAKRQPVSDDYFYEVSGIPKPANYEQEKARMEAERTAQLNPDDNDDDPPAPKKAKKPAKKKPAPANQSDDLTWLQQFRMKLADFFDPAHKS